MPLRYPKCFLSGSFAVDDEVVFNWFADMLRSLEFQVISGKEPEPSPPHEKIRERIRDSDVLVAIITRRDRVSETEKWKGPEWVHSEIGMAYEAEKPVAVFAEKGIDMSGLGPSIADYVTFDREDFGSSAPMIVRYLISVRSLITSLPTLREDVALMKALAVELFEFASLIEVADQDLEIIRWPMTYAYGKVTGRLLMLPAEVQNDVQEAYVAISTFKDYLRSLRADLHPPLLSKEKPGERKERESRFESRHAKYQEEKERVLRACSQAIRRLFEIGFPELKGFLEQLSEQVRAQQ